MNLPFIKNFNKKVLPSYFLVLILRDEKANAVIFEELEGRVKIIGQKEQHFPNSIDLVSSEEFLQTLDKAISHAESTLPENIQTQKTIFGVKESWTENDQIKKEYLAKLKKASEELGLTPIGFLVISQAISHLLQKEEGAPISAILTEVNKKSITVTLIRAGKSIETKSSEIHESIPFTVDTLLKHFNVPEILPSRIIIFNGQEDLSQEFISHTWSKSLPFLHLPQITNLPEGFDAKSVLFGAATQMGFAITETQRMDEAQKETEMQNISLPSSDFVNSVENSVTTVSAGDFGFSKDIDVAKMPIRDINVLVADEEEPIDIEEKMESIPQIREETFPTTTKSTKNINIFLILAKNISFAILSIMFILLKKINIKNVLSIFTRSPKGKLTIIFPLILILVIALISSYFLFLKATIQITVDPKITEQKKNILFSTINRTDPTTSTIKGEFVTVSQDGSVSTQTTGKKAVGDKAKGTVTIYNTSSTPATLSAGLKITSSNNLVVFLLDKSISVPKGDPIDAGKANVAVTAEEIGKNGNIPEKNKFTFSGNDSILAINGESFSGGTSREITVVSNNDQIKLEQELPKQLEEKARENLLKNIGKDKVLLPSFVSTSLSKKSLNVKVGDQASQVTLTGTVEFQGISYDKKDLILFSKSLLEKDVPSGQQIDYNNIKTAVLDIKQNNDEEVEANLNIKTLLLPKIDQIKLIKEVKGKSFKTAEDLLYKLPQVSDIDIYFSPKLPFLPKNLPMREKNIKILINIDG